MLRRFFGRNVEGPKAREFKVIPVGGMSAIGEKNAFLVKYGDDAVGIDWGEKIQNNELLDDENGEGSSGDRFPDMSCLDGVNLLAMCFTHGHYDHIGGWFKPFERFVDIPAICDQFTEAPMRMIARKHRITWFPKVIYDRVTRIGPFRITRFPVNHSIPGSCGFLIEAMEGAGEEEKIIARVVFSGDCKGWIPWEDEEKGVIVDKNINVLSELVKDGPLDLLVLDSTNSEKTDRLISENRVARATAEILFENLGRVFIVMFSSNTMRARMVIEEANKMSRSVYVAGPTMRELLHADGVAGWHALEAKGGNGKKHLEPAPETLPHNVVILCTGLQAEKGSFLYRMANGEIDLPYNRGDILIVSGSVIPRDEVRGRFIPMMMTLAGRFGNERHFDTIYIPPQAPHIPLLRDDGAKIERNPYLHVTGHGTREHKKTWVEVLKPRFVMPCHGGESIRKLLADLVREWGGEAVLLNDGEEFVLPPRATA